MFNIEKYIIKSLFLKNKIQTDRTYKAIIILIEHINH